MVKVYISQPMRDKSADQIQAEREILARKVRKRFPDNVEVEILDSYFPQAAPVIGTRSLWYLGKCLQVLSTANVAYFAQGWNDARGCRIEHTCAEQYGIEIMEEERRK